MNQKGLTLVELMVVLLLLGVSTSLMANSLISRSKKSADVDAIKSLLNLAARRSVIEAKHFGVHFDSTQHTASLFEDINNDDLYSGTDTLAMLAKLNPLTKVLIATTASVPLTDICFKKNGATSTGNSFEITYLPMKGDTVKMQVIAASGRVMGP